MAKSVLTPQADNYPQWYQDVVAKAEMAENGPVRGTMVIRPYGYAIWERMQRELDDRIKGAGARNAYFPLLIPESYLHKEAEHVEGFSPELAVVTHGGGKELEEPVVVRPTSETIINSYFAKWVQSYRDLPLLINQWANVVRWEMRPRLFLRTTEVLWQEGHTAHETADQAMQETLMILHEVYLDAYEKVMAVPPHPGRKSASERFPGAVETYTLEALMRDRKALQSCTSHYLGQNFAKAYGVKFLGREGSEELAYAASGGLSTRAVGAGIMTHGDDKGLRLPPALAPIQCVLVPIYRNEEERARVLEAAERLVADLGVRAHVDDRDDLRPGFKFNDWELKGVPVRIELGPRDLDASQAVLVRRDTGEKETVGLDAVPGRVRDLLDVIQTALYSQAREFRDRYTFRPASYDELRSLAEDPGGFLVAPWCASPDCEAKVKADTKATIRFLRIEPGGDFGRCIVCGEPATEEATWAQAY